MKDEKKTLAYLWIITHSTCWGSNCTAKVQQSSTKGITGKDSVVLGYKHKSTVVQTVLKTRTTWMRWEVDLPLLCPTVKMKGRVHFVMFFICFYSKDQGKLPRELLYCMSGVTGGTDPDAGGLGRLVLGL